MLYYRMQLNMYNQIHLQHKPPILNSLMPAGIYLLQLKYFGLPEEISHGVKLTIGFLIFR